MNHRCLDCQAVRFINRKESLRAARPKCYGCGSSRLEPVKKPEQAEEQEQGINQGK